MNKKLILFGLSVILSSECLSLEHPKSCEIVIGSHAAVTPVSRADKPWWMARHLAVLNRVAQGQVDLLMIGDSITHRWERAGAAVWEKYYAPRNAVNLGFGGDRTEHVLWRLENGEIDNINPKLAVLMIGTNNSNGDEYTAGQIADGIKAIVCTLRTRLPGTKILILSIFPRGDEEQRLRNGCNAAFNDQWKKNDQASQLAATIADNQTVFFLDLNKAFLDKDGLLMRDAMPDLLHPEEKGYQLWAEAMEPTLAGLLEKAK